MEEIITPSEIKETLEPLVEALSQLVLSTVTGQLVDVQQHCVNMANSTNDIVQIAKKVALQSEDEALIVEITDAINDIAGNINVFVTSFTKVITNKEDVDAAKSFADSAKILGDAINTLVIITDETSQRRMITLVRNAINAMKNLEKTLGKYPQMGAVNGASRESTLMNNKLVEVSGRASVSTSNSQKRSLLDEGSERVRALNPKVVAVAKSIVESPHNQTIRNEFRDLANKLSEGYSLIIKAVKLEADGHMEGLWDTLDYLTKLLDNAKNLQKWASELLDGCLKDDKVKIQVSGPKTSGFTNDIADQAQFAYDNEKDPVRKEFMRGGLEDLKHYGDLLQSAGKNTLKDGASNKNKQDASTGYTGLMNAVERLVLGSRKQAFDEYPIHIATEALNSAADALIKAAEDGDIKGLLEAAKRLVDIAKKAHQDLVRKANRTEDPNEKAAILKAAEELKDSSMGVITAAKSVANDPSKDNVNKLKSAKRKLEDAISRARQLEATPPGFTPMPVYAAEEEVKVEAVKPREWTDLDFMPDPNDPPLVKASKEQARAALEILREAEMAAKDDPDLLAKVRKEGDDLKKWARNLVEASYKAAENPDDPNAQAALQNAQKMLNDAVGRVTNLTRGKNADLDEALRLLQQSTQDEEEEMGGELMKLIREFQDEAMKVKKEIQSNYGKDAPSSDTQALITNAKDTQASAKKLAGLLRSMHKLLGDDPQFRDNILNCSHIINDKGLQLKILAAVKASEGGDSGGQVSSAALGLETQVDHVLEQVRNLALRSRVKNTERITRIMKRIAAAVRRGRNQGY